MWWLLVEPSWLVAGCQEWPVSAQSAACHMIDGWSFLQQPPVFLSWLQSIPTWLLAVILMYCYFVHHSLSGSSQSKQDKTNQLLLAADHFKTKVLGDFCSIWLGTIATTIKLRQVLIAQLRVPFAASWWNWLGWLTKSMLSRKQTEEEFRPRAFKTASCHYSLSRLLQKLKPCVEHTVAYSFCTIWSSTSIGHRTKNKYVVLYTHFFS